MKREKISKYIKNDHAISRHFLRLLAQYNTTMNIDLFSPSIIGAIAGMLGVLVASYLVRSKKLKIGEGRKMGLNFSPDLKSGSHASR